MENNFSCTSIIVHRKLDHCSRHFPPEVLARTGTILHHKIKHAPQELADLFKCLEIEFNPLRLAERVEQCLDWLKDENRNPYHELLSPYS